MVWRRIETRTRQRNPVRVKCEVLRAHLWSVVMNWSQVDS